MLNKEKPTLVLSDHPPLQRMAPVIWQYLSGERQGVLLADHSMTAITNFLGIEIIPVLRNPNKINSQTKGEEYKQKILSVLGYFTNSAPDYIHQGKEVTHQVVDALQDKNVLISPSGATNRLAKWKPGVSHIISEAAQSLQDFSLSFLYIPDSFREKFSYVLFDSWMNVLDSESLDWGDDHRVNAAALQLYFESLRA
jgi:hypothetical protein